MVPFEQMVVQCPAQHGILSELPKSGIWSDVMGIVADTLSWNTVNERSTVTPGTRNLEVWAFLLSFRKKTQTALSLDYPDHQYY